MCSRYAVILWAFILSAIHAKAGTYFTIANGAWTNGNIWSLTMNGRSCNCVPRGSDNINISHTVTLDKTLTNGNSSLGGLSGQMNITESGNLNGGTVFNMDVLSQGNLIVCGRLTVKNLEFFNGSGFYFCTGSNVTVNGNFINRNNSPNIIVDGTVIITGSFENGTGAIITGNGGFVINNGPAVNNGSLFGCVGQYPCGVYPCYISSMCGTSTVLPVEWLSFEVSAMNNGRLLKWSTATESNTDFFQVQISTDGKEFETIGHLAAAGNSSTIRSYEFFDQETRNGTLYYRIRQIDYDGQFMLSETRFFIDKTENTIMVIPNPITESKFHLQKDNNLDGEWQVILYDQLGRKILDKSGYAEAQSQNDLEFEMPEGVEPGCYTLVAILDGRSHSERIMFAP
ncbi:MAG: hypothetical protein ACKOKF_06190 [Bacteroidota bacterium]